APSTRTTRVTKGTSPLPAQDEDEEDDGPKSTVRRSSRLVVPGSPERKKQRSSTEPEQPKKGATSGRRSKIPTQTLAPARILTRRQQSLLEE
ncbi:hypothetical protein FRC03_002116, partial [Tulasnella sp. 419]